MKSSGLLTRPTDDAIISNMKGKRYNAALVLLTQLSIENSGLSASNQVRYIQCLYHTKRYLAALEKCRQFSESGNTVPELMFLRGLCQFQLGQFVPAQEAFRKRREWCRWAKKAELRRDSTATVIRIGEMPSKNDDEKVSTPEFRQTHADIEIAIPLEGLDPADLRISAGELWLDLTYDDGRRKVAKSWELFAKVDPMSLKVDVTPAGVDVRLNKAEQQEWPTLDTKVDIEEPLEELLASLGIPEYTDDAAAEQFEKSIALAKEEGIDISSWFVD
jgi:tetratricopeptide (TPR) repeat protein